jgi:hypothetical protein
MTAAGNRKEKGNERAQEEFYLEVSFVPRNELLNY